MFPPKDRRITPFVTIPVGMARLFFGFFDFFFGGESCRGSRVGCGYARDTRATTAPNPPTEDLTTNEHQ